MTAPAGPGSSCTDRAAAFAGARGIRDIDVSLSHAGGLAVAQAAAVCDADEGASCGST